MKGEWDVDRLEQLENLIAQAGEMHDIDVFWVHPTQTLYEAIDSEILQPLEAHIAELEAQIAAANEKLAGVAGEWVPVTDIKCDDGDPDYDCDCNSLIDPHADDDRRLYISDDGTTLEFSIEGGALEGTFMLPDGYAICRKAPGTERDLNFGVIGLQSSTRDEIWVCAGCGKVPGPNEGTDDLPELCDDCWAKARNL